MPPELHQWLEEGHLAYFISDVADLRAWAVLRRGLQAEGPLICLNYNSLKLVRNS